MIDPGDCYRLLGLRSGASFADIKASYRRLVQKYHPDINQNDEKAKDKFIALTEAYKLLQATIPQEKRATRLRRSPSSDYSYPKSSEETSGKSARKTTVSSHPPTLVDIEHRLKWKTYDQLQRFLQAKQFPQAIALAEALMARLPSDAEARQWLAISYQMCGRALIAANQLSKAKIYLKKALKIDPYNRTLWQEVQQDFQNLT